MVDSSTNYGDELNSYIISQLSTQKVRHIPYPYKWYYIPYKYLHALIFKSEYASLKGAIRSIFAKKIVFGIGSILHKYNRKNVYVWGSGIGHIDWKIDNANFTAVRGVYTQKKLTDLGYIAPSIIGDPALLLPLLISKSKKKYKFGVIPHYVQFDDVKNNYKSPIDSIIINMKEDIYSVTDKISSSDFVISSSLHGLIVAHSYNIPALWVNFDSNNKLAGDNVKFKDYFSSVGIEAYSPIYIQTLEPSFLENIKYEHHNKLYINFDLRKIQIELLKVAPFRLKEKFVNISYE